MSQDDLHNTLHKTRHPLLSKENAITEANRCINCYDAPCIHACPTSINIPQFISRIANDDLDGSAQSILASNILGYSCATVCPVEVLCEGACVYNNQEDPPIRIGDLQKYGLDDFYKKDAKQQVASLLSSKNGGDKQNNPALSTQNIKVAAIGGGPASLSFAAYIALNGGNADIYEKDEESGGLNTYGIAPYKLSYEESMSEVEFIKNLGVTIKNGMDVGKNTQGGKDISAADLLQDYDAVFIGSGLGADSFALKADGIGKVYGALPLIAELKQKNFATISGVRSAIVVGGGNTALDIAQELALCGVTKVIMAYRRGTDVMSGYAHELKYAKSLGVEFLPHHKPVALQGSSKGDFASISFETPDGSKEINGDLLVFATGQQKHPLQEIFPALKLNDNGTVAVNHKMQTNVDKLYAGGDCVNGGKEVVNAVAEGRQAAYHTLLTNNKEIYYGRFSN